MKVAITGGGLVGALCSCIMGQRGHHVDLYEYRPDPRTPDAKFSRGKSINLALSTRGRTALRRAGLEDSILSNGIPMKGRMLHSLDGTRKEVLYDPLGNQCIYSVSRSFLNNVLLTEAEKLGNVKLHFEHKLESADPIKGHLKFRKRNMGHNSQVEVQADLVVGADGAHSAMRQAILRSSRTNYSQTYIEHGYMELCIPALSNGEHAMETNYLHIWPRNEFMLIALPNQDGSFTVTLFMPFDKFDNLDTPGAVLDFFEREFPDSIPLIGEERLVQDFLTSKSSPLISVKCSPLNVGKAVLVGDAAHAMVPFYGQGMNAGFEDILILDDLLSEWSKNGVEQYLTNFSEERSKDAQAICELAMYNYVEMRHLVNKKGYYFRRFVDLMLYKMLGNSWLPLYNAVTFSRVPYSECISNRKKQDELLDKFAKFLAYGTFGGVLAYVVCSRKGLSLLEPGPAIARIFSSAAKTFSR